MNRPGQPQWARDTGRPLSGAGHYTECCWTAATALADFGQDAVNLHVGKVGELEGLEEVGVKDVSRNAAAAFKG